jgi:hypothetical protein
MAAGLSAIGHVGLLCVAPLRTTQHGERLRKSKDERFTDGRVAEALSRCAELPSPQRRLGLRRVKGDAVIAPWGPGLRGTTL